MFCTFCGKELYDDAVICPSCGRLTDKGGQVMKSASAEPAAPSIQPKEKKKERVPRGTIIAFVALAVYILGEIINTTISTSINRNIIIDGPVISESVIVVMSGIFSVICLGMTITSVALIFAERASAIRRVFPLCMLMVSIVYFIEFVCSAVLLNAYSI